MKDGRLDYVGSIIGSTFDAIKNGTFGDLTIIHNYLNHICNGGDYYINCYDFKSYVEAQNKVDETYLNYKKWTSMAIRGISKSGKFSSDRTISEYCEYIWDIEPVSVPHGSYEANKRVTSYANDSIDD